MEIIIQVEGEETREKITFSNEQLSNLNFIDMVVGGKEYTVSIQDLLLVAKVFSQPGLNCLPETRSERILPEYAESTRE